MIKPLSITPESPALRTQQERAQLRSTPRSSAAEAAPSSVADANSPPPVTAVPLVPELGALVARTAAPARHEQSFDISAESLGDLLARINITGAGVTTRISDASRRVQIASLGPSGQAAGLSLQAQLRITDSPFSRQPADEVAEQQLVEALEKPSSAATLGPDAPTVDNAADVHSAVQGASLSPAAPGGPVAVGSSRGEEAPAPGTLVDVLG